MLVDRPGSVVLLFLSAAIAACGPSITDGGAAQATGATSSAGTGGAAASSSGAGAANVDDCAGACAKPSCTASPACEGVDPIVRLSQGAPRCGVRASGRLVCWGPVPEDPPPAAMEGIDDAASAVHFLEHGCLKHASGAVSCWGFSHHGQLGEAVAIGASSDAPMLLPGVEVAVLATGHHHVCGIRSSGQAICWGGPYSPSLGKVGVGQTQAPIEVTGLGDAIDISATIEHTCAVRASGDVACWGWNGGGELGDGTTDARPEPAAVVDLHDATRVAAGFTGSCALRANGQATCWGYDVGPFATDIGGFDGLVQLSAGYDQVCGLRASGDVLCWSGEYVAKPEAIEVHDAVDVAADFNTKGGCAVRASGEEVVCWSGDGPPAKIEGLD